MKTIATLIALPLFIAALSVFARAADPAAPSIVGSYILDYRELPDGKQVRPPEVVGMMTFTKDHRNFNIHWMQDGKPVSISLISTYTLSATEYAEQNVYYMENNMPGGPGGIKYDHEPTAGKSPITIDGDKIQCKLPLHDEPNVVFQGATMTASRAGAFVDHWKKVE